MDGALVVGRRPSRREVVLMVVLLGFVFPGLGVVIVPFVLFVDHQWGGLGWVAFWCLPALLTWRLARRHQIVGDTVETTSVHGTDHRELSAVVEIRPARWRFPAGRVQFVDGSALWAVGPATSAFVEAAAAGAPPGTNRIPTGNWLRSRRLLWFAVLAVVGMNGS